MTQMILSLKQTRLIDIENGLVVAVLYGQGRKGWIGRLELVDDSYIWRGETTRSYCIAQGTTFNILR